MNTTVLTALFAASSPGVIVTSSGSAALEVGGYVEAFYSYNTNDPPTGVTGFRGFDNRHDTLTLSNVALDVKGNLGDAYARVALQFGLTPNTYYLAEPVVAAESGAGDSGPTTWRFIQQAYAGFRFDPGIPLEIEAGVFLSPVGPESIAVRDDWLFSRSVLFFGLPFYHTGIRATASLDDSWKLMLLATSGWNTVLDNNDSKSLAVQLSYARAPLTFALLYFGGPERSAGAAEGPAWRSLFDLWAQYDLTDSLSILAHADTGFEPNRLGTSLWIAGALSGRLELMEELFVALRADVLAEKAGADGGAAAATIFWPAADADGWAAVSSLTGGVDLRPHPNVSLRLEGRHDQANVPIYAASSGLEKHQTTITAAVVGWF